MIIFLTVRKISVNFFENEDFLILIFHITSPFLLKVDKSFALALLKVNNIHNIKTKWLLSEFLTFKSITFNLKILTLKIKKMFTVEYKFYELKNNQNNISVKIVLK